MVSVDDDPIKLVPARYESWRTQFRTERDRIQTVLSAHPLETQLRHIEHVGSTAIPRLSAKDTVDLDVVVADSAGGTVSRTLERELSGDRVENTDL